MLANGVEPVGCPTWVPEDYSLNRVTTLVSSDSTKFVALYISPQRDEMFIRLTVSDDSMSSIFEKDTGGYVYTNHDIDFNVMENLESVNIEWQIGTLLYSITGPLQVNEIESMIYSIEGIN